MKKKGLIIYSIVWLICFAAFNVIAFVVPAMPRYPKFTVPFWIGYGVGAGAFVAQLVCSIVLFFKDKGAERRFLNLSIYRTSFIALIVCTVIGIVCMAVSVIPGWVAAIVCVLVTVYYVIAMLLAKIAIGDVEAVGENVKARTATMRELTAEADMLQGRAPTAQLKELAKKVYEALRYSDPMSNDALAEQEEEIRVQLNAFKEQVMGSEEEAASESTEKLLLMIAARNAKCKATK